MSIEQVVFLVGGKGTRLGSLTAQTPKPLLDVGGRPFLDTLIENAARYGLRRVILLAGYLGASVADRYREWGGERGIDIQCVIEPEPAGTGGALKYAANRLDDVFFLCNGDSWFDFNLLDLAQTALATEQTATLALRRVPDGGRYGVVECDGSRITVLQERGAAGQAALVNGGVYVLRRSILSWIKELPNSIERDVFPALADAGKLSGKEYRGFFLDIGIPDDFAAAQTTVSRQQTRPAVFFDRDGVLNHDQGYTHRAEDFRWCEGAIDAIRFFNDSGYYVFVVTNQGGVAHGYYDEEAVNTLHAWMQDELAAHGAHIDRFYFCPHHPQGTRAQYAVACDCRKPAPGMIKAALREWPVELEASFLVGDKPSDLAAAEAAGLRGLHWSGGNLLDVLRPFANTLSAR